MDGHLLLHVDDKFALHSLGVANALKRKKLLIQIEQLKKLQIQRLKEKSMDGLDEYVMMLESHRIKVTLDFLSQVCRVH